jgi:oxygen-independent coproporphyrinogen-3 oxidase
MYELTEALTRGQGLVAYEVSNYAAPGQESRHNLAYWRGHDYAGIGAGAHGRLSIHGQRMATLNLKSPELWLSAVQARGNGLESLTPLTPQQIAEERLMMGLRLKDGIELATASDFIDDGKRRFAIAEGLLENSEDRLAATPKGRLVLTALTAMLLRNMNDV